MRLAQNSYFSICVFRFELDTVDCVALFNEIKIAKHVEMKIKTAFVLHRFSGSSSLPPF